jgi:S-formylglutathione hydrolase FrmB
MHNSRELTVTLRGWQLVKLGTAILLIGLLTHAAAVNCYANQAHHSSATGARPTHSVVERLFHSASLNRDMHYRVLLPRGYQTGAKHFAVLYLLHGLYGDYSNWVNNTKLEQYAKPLPLIIVMPDAGDSWYTNSATLPGDKYEDYIVKDLIPEIDTHFRTIRTRAARALAGLSMGGYGAMKFALKYPEIFAFAGSLSGAFDAPLNLDSRVPEFREKLLLVFGPRDDPNRSANDLFLLLDQIDASHLPFLYVECGTEDGFLPINREFVSSLPRRKIAYEYEETPGDHSWNYWDRSVQDVLRSLTKILNLSGD